jgi:hypothetical protein
MDNKTKTMLATMIGVAVLMSVAVLAGAETPTNLRPQALAPSLVSYQGQVTTNGSPHDGVGYFKFAVVNSAGDTTFWSNDGTSTGGEEPTNPVELDVEDGLFNVLLGDSSFGMTPLTAAVFTGSDRHLRAWFSSDGAAYDQLVPDQQLASVPYALQAQYAQDADTLDGRDASSFADAGSGNGGSLPSGTMVLGSTPHDASLLNSGFHYTGRFVGDSWSTRQPMPTERWLLAAATADDVIYTVGGLEKELGKQASNEAYDPATNSWTTKAPMPTARYLLGAAGLDGIVYAIGGADYDIDEAWVTSANEAYDPATDSWTTKAPMPTAREGLAVAALDGLVYAIGGRDGVSDLYEGSPVSVVEAYDPETDSWSTRAPMPTPRERLGVGVMDGLLYAIGGRNGSGCGTWVEVYDPATDSWTARSPMLTDTELVGVAVLDDVIYAIGGQFGCSRQVTNQAYSPETDRWQFRNPLPSHSWVVVAASARGAMYVFCQEIAQVYSPPMYVYRKQ